MSAKIDERTNNKKVVRTLSCGIERQGLKESVVQGLISITSANVPSPTSIGEHMSLLAGKIPK